MAVMHHSLHSLTLKLRELASGEGGGSGAEGKAPGQVLAEGCSLVEAVRQQVSGWLAGGVGVGEGGMEWQANGRGRTVGRGAGGDQHPSGAVHDAKCWQRSTVALCHSAQTRLPPPVSAPTARHHPHPPHARRMQLTPAAALPPATCDLQIEDLTRSSSKRLELARTQLDHDRACLAELASQMQGLNNEVLKLTEVNKVGAGHWVLGAGHAGCVALSIGMGRGH